MPNLGEAVAPRQIALELLDRAVVDQRHDAAAFHADEMIVVTAWIQQLKVARGPTQVHALDEPKGFELLHRAKDGREIRHAAVVRGMFANLLEAQGGLRREQRPQNRAAILRHAQPGALKLVDQVFVRQRRVTAPWRVRGRRRRVPPKDAVSRTHVLTMPEPA